MTGATPFTAAQASERGLTRGQLRGPRFQRLHPGVWLERDAQLTAMTLIRAAVASLPEGTLVSHHSAAAALGLPVPPCPTVHVTVLDQALRRRRDGVRIHVRRRAPTTTRAHGLTVISGLDLLTDLAQHLDLVDLVVLGDAMLGRELDRPRDLAAAADRRGPLGAAAGLMRAGVDSPMETRLRLLLVLAGLPEPVVAHALRRADGTVRFRLDLSWPHALVAVEYDGQHHRADLDQWDRDIDRHDWLRQQGWEVVVVISRGVFLRPEETLARVRTSLESRGVRLPQAREDWRPHFPVSGRH